MNLRNSAAGQTTGARRRKGARICPDSGGEEGEASCLASGHKIGLRRRLVPEKRYALGVGPRHVSRSICTRWLARLLADSDQALSSGIRCAGPSAVPIVIQPNAAAPRIKRFNRRSVAVPLPNRQRARRLDPLAGVYVVGLWRVRARLRSYLVGVVSLAARRSRTAPSCASFVP